MRLIWVFVLCLLVSVASGESSRFRPIRGIHGFFGVGGGNPTLGSHFSGTVEFPYFALGYHTWKVQEVGLFSDKKSPREHFRSQALLLKLKLHTDVLWLSAGLGPGVGTGTRRGNFLGEEDVFWGGAIEEYEEINWDGIGLAMELEAIRKYKYVGLGLGVNVFSDKAFMVKFGIYLGTAPFE